MDTYNRSPSLDTPSPSPSFGRGISLRSVPNEAGYTQLEGDDIEAAHNGDGAAAKEDGDGAVQGNKLNMYFGVFQPCMLNIFGAILFLRLPWAIGKTGWLGVISMFLLAGVTVTLTTCSIAAISTNGRVRGGGAYFMISRSLGAEFGGSVGIVYYLAAAVGVTFYLTAFAESFCSFGIAGFDEMGEEQQGWTQFAVGSVTLIVLFVQANVGASFFLKFNTLIFAILVASIIIGGVSFIGAAGTKPEVPDFVGPNWDTFGRNRWLVPDYTTYFEVFIVIFPAVTGIMAGANYSGDLADPGGSIGPGTLYAIMCSLSIYMVLTLIIGASVEKDTLVGNLTIFQDCSYSEGMIIAGIVMSTLSSALGSLVGSARVMQALARDNLMAWLSVFSYGSKKGDEPRVALVLTYLIAQLALLDKSLNSISKVISNFYLLVYFFINFACFVLRVTGAPNFRPEFRYFSWHTAAGGAALTAFIMFISSPSYALISIAVIILLAVLVHYIAPVVPWGDVTQVVIYHQVRKYLLRLDVRKEHPKFWRPSIMLALDRPHLSLNLIDVSNDLKKGGLLIIGNVIRGTPDANVAAASRTLRQSWYNYIGQAKVKAFFELCVAPSCRVGFNNLMLSAGLGGMKVNTVILQCFSPRPEQGGANGPKRLKDTLRRSVSNPYQRAQLFEQMERCKDVLNTIEKTLDNCDDSHIQNEGEYVNIVNDCILFKQNVLIAKGFDEIDKESIISFNRRAKRMGLEQEYMTIDVWAHASRSNGDWDNIRGNFSLALQLAHGLQRQGVWKTHTTLRAVVAVEIDQGADASLQEGAISGVHDRLALLLKTIRVFATLTVFAIEGAGTGTIERDFNDVVEKQSRTTAISFLPMPALPGHNGQAESVEFIRKLDDLTKDLPPTLLVLSANQATMSVEL